MAQYLWIVHSHGVYSSGSGDCHFICANSIWNLALFPFGLFNYRYFVFQLFSQLVDLLFAN